MGGRAGCRMPVRKIHRDDLHVNSLLWASIPLTQLMNEPDCFIHCERDHASSVPKLIPNPDKHCIFMFSLCFRSLSPSCDFFAGTPQTRKAAQNCHYRSGFAGLPGVFTPPFTPHPFKPHPVTQHPGTPNIGRQSGALHAAMSIRFWASFGACYRPLVLVHFAGFFGRHGAKKPEPA